MNGPSGPEHRGNASGRKHIYIKKRAGRMRCTCQEKVDSKKNIYQKPRSVLN